MQIVQNVPTIVLDNTIFFLNCRFLCGVIVKSEHKEEVTLIRQSLSNRPIGEHFL